MTIFWRNRERRSGFSLIELLTVIAVMAILASILVPVVGVVQRTAAVSATRSRLAQYTTAYHAFKAEHGFYPSMGASGAEFGLEGSNAVFIETLSGRTLAGEATTHPYARAANPRRLRYYTFHASEFGAAGSSGEGQIVDGLGNPQIFVVIDRDQDGVIEADDFETLPMAMRPESLPGGAYFYSANPTENEDWEWILSWE